MFVLIFHWLLLAKKKQCSYCSLQGRGCWRMKQEPKGCSAARWSPQPLAHTVFIKLTSVFSLIQRLCHLCLSPSSSALNQKPICA